MKKIAVVGLGQIGGSMVLTLRRRRKNYFLTGIDTSLKRLRFLKNSLNRTSAKWEDVTGSDLVVVCLHFQQTKDFLDQVDPNQLMMDVCSGKAKLVHRANQQKKRFIGGHPMTGNEFAGEKGWRDDLFEEAPFFLCPAKASSDSDLRMLRKFIRDLGGRPLTVDPERHDRFVAITSHFPAALAGLIRKMGEEVPVAFQGPGFQSMTRLAKTSPELMETFLQSNGEQIFRSANQLQKLLARWIKSNSLQR